jgi:hypothetical protein
MSTNDFFIFSNNLLNKKTLRLFNRYGTYPSVLRERSRVFNQSLPQNQYFLIPNETAITILYSSVNFFNLDSDPINQLICYKILRQRQFLFLLKL